MVPAFTMFDVAASRDVTTSRVRALAPRSRYRKLANWAMGTRLHVGVWYMVWASTKLDCEIETGRLNTSTRGHQYKILSKQ